MHGGSIYCKSSSSEGTEFIFTLKKSQVLVDTDFEINLPNRIGKGLLVHRGSNALGGGLNFEETPQILIVEDDLFIGEIWSKDLGKNGIVFSKPEELLEAISQKKIDIRKVKVVVTDFFFDNNSKYDGCSFAEEIKIYKHIKIILCSDVSLKSSKLNLFDNKIPKQTLTASELLLL